MIERRPRLVDFPRLLIANELVDLITAEVHAQIRERRDLTEDDVTSHIARCIAEALDGTAA